MSLTATDILNSPDYYPLQLQGANVMFVKMSRQTYRKSIFTLPSRIVTDGTQAWSVPLKDLVVMADQLACSPRAIFQIAHCGSTLLSRALDHVDKTLVIREPYVLRQLAAVSETQHRQQKRQAIKAIWRLLGRKYHDQQSVIVKGSVPVNFVLPDLQVNSRLKAVLLYSDFEDYLLAILKSTERQQWAKQVCQELKHPITLLTATESLDYTSLDGAQAASLLWCSQLASFRQANSSNPEMMPIKASKLFANPTPCLQQCDAHLQLEIDETWLQQQVQGDLFSQHAKQGNQKYSPAQRKIDMADLRRRYTSRVNEVSAWAIDSGLSVVDPDFGTLK